MKTSRIRPPTIIFDLDGTLADVSSIRYLVAAGEKNRNFDAFHRESVNCPPIPWVVEHAHTAHADGYKVVQVTARSERYRPHTSWWLAEHGIPSHELYMRGDYDYRPDYEVKRDIVDRILQSHDIVKAFDDNPSIVRLWGEYGIPCIVVPGWEY